jgi:CheY-like chemotaxis protein
LVEDDPVDAMAIRRALQDANAAGPVTHVPSVSQALARLRSSEDEKPALILLDLNMPGTDGLEFLETVKSDPDLAEIPVVVLTSSQESRDILRSFDLGIAGYMVKTAHYEGFLQTIRTIQDYWRLSQSPTHRSACGR